MNRSYTTDADIRDMVIETLEAGHSAQDFDIDAIAGDLMEAAHYDGRAFTDLPEGDEFWEIVARHDTTEVIESHDALATGTTVSIGPKNRTDRLYRIIEITEPENYFRSARTFRKVKLVRLTDDTTWMVTIKGDAKRIPWNARLMGVTTDADRRRAIDAEIAKLEAANQAQNTNSGENTFTDEEEARATRRHLINQGRSVSLLAYDPSRNLHVFDVLN